LYSFSNKNETDTDGGRACTVIYIVGATIVTINVLVCRPDGSQSMEQREVADDYLAVKEEPTDEQQQ
jgi:hypothetical protein